MFKLYKLVKKSWWQLLIIIALVAGPNTFTANITGLY